jgi:hypothetical protein
MTKKPTKADDKFPRKVIQIMAGKTNEEVGRNVAATLTSPEMAAYRVIKGAERSSSLGKEFDVPTLLAYLREQAAEVQGGNLAHVEAMLMNQAMALQTLFARLAERGMSCDVIPSFEANLRMALRAQAQCRATLETLALVKNPPSVAFVRQANIAGGHQQVNNGLPDPSRARENESLQSKLLEAHDGERLDTGTTKATGGADPLLATVGEINGAKDDSRKS